jgi:hypothetical protein
MFSRVKFITNSSSTSFTAYGIELDYNAVDVIMFLLNRDPKLMDKFIEEFVDDPMSAESFRENPREFIEQEDMQYEALEFALPESVYVERVPDDNYYLCIGFPEIILHSDGNCSLRDPDELKQGYKDLTEIIDGIGHGTGIELQSEAYYS